MRTATAGNSALPLICCVAVLWWALWPASTLAQQDLPLALAQVLARTHVHGLALDPAHPERLLIATHHGLLVANGAGGAAYLSERRDDFMGFTPHPSDASRLFASGHPVSGGNLGVIASRDGGRTWQRISNGAGAPVDFHQMDISTADPNVLYGVYGALQVSRDGGLTWRTTGAKLDAVIDLAASSSTLATLYLATRTGLRISRDGGLTWQPAHLRQSVATLVFAHQGSVYAFMPGVGLLRAREDSVPNWETLANGFGESVLLHMAADPQRPERLFAASQRNEIFSSGDGGRNWRLWAAAQR